MVSWNLNFIFFTNFQGFFLLWLRKKLYIITRFELNHTEVTLENHLDRSNQVSLNCQKLFKFWDKNLKFSSFFWVFTLNLILEQPLNYFEKYFLLKKIWYLIKDFFIRRNWKLKHENENWKKQKKRGRFRFSVNQILTENEPSDIQTSFDDFLFGLDSQLNEKFE